MDFFYSSLIETRLPGAYERLLLDAMRGDSLLYSRSDALELSWHFLTPLLESWERDGDEGLIAYPAGCKIPREVVDRILPDPCLLEENACTLCNTRRP